MSSDEVEVLVGRIFALDTEAQREFCRISKGEMMAAPTTSNRMQSPGSLACLLANCPGEQRLRVWMELAPLQSRSDFPELDRLIRRGRLDVLRARLQGAEQACPSDGRETLLHVAARHGAGALRTLLDAGADPNVRDAGGETPLHWLLWNDSVARGDIEGLLDAGARLDVRNCRGQTPLAGMRHSHDLAVEMTWLLLRAGANLLATDHDGVTIIDEVRVRLDQYLEREGYEPLGAAATELHFEQLAERLRGLSKTSRLFENLADCFLLMRAVMLRAGPEDWQRARDPARFSHAHHIGAVLRSSSVGPIMLFCGQTAVRLSASQRRAERALRASFDAELLPRIRECLAETPIASFCWVDLSDRRNPTVEWIRSTSGRAKLDSGAVMLVQDGQLKTVRPLRGSQHHIDTWLCAMRRCLFDVFSDAWLGSWW